MPVSFKFRVFPGSGKASVVHHHKLVKFTNIQPNSSVEIPVPSLMMFFAQDRNNSNSEVRESSWALLKKLLGGEMEVLDFVGGAHCSNGGGAAIQGEGGAL